MAAPPTPLQALQALLPSASPAAQALGASSHTLQRYLTAHRDSVPKALAGIEATAAWRAKAILPGFSCALCAARPGAHCWVSLGCTADGCALIYGAPARASEGGEVEGTLAHCVNSLERQWEGGAGEAAGGSGQWVWLVDFREFGVTHALQARLGMAFATVFKDHFPERLRAIVLLNPPLLFRGLVAAIGAVADKRTLDKLRVVEAPSAQGLCARLREEHGVVDESILAWLQRAFTEPAVPGTLPALPQHVQHLQV